MTDRALISRLWRDYVSKHLGRLLLAFLFMIVVAAATAAYAVVVKYVVDTITALAETPDVNPVDNAKRFVMLVAPVLVGVTFISGLSLFLQAILSNSVALRVVGLLQKDMFASLHRADFARFQREAVGNLVSRFTNDVNLVAQMLLRTMSNHIITGHPRFLNLRHIHFFRGRTRVRQLHISSSSLILLHLL